jgi:hypothetical protein
VLWGAHGLAERPGGLAGHAVVLCPTIAPQEVERIAARLAAMGVDTLDAPMSGGPQRAAEGTMSLMVACPLATFEKHRTLIGALSDRVFRLGERPGDGARMKLVNNLLAGINLVGAAEALALAQRLGLDLDTVLDVIEQSSGQSWVGSDRMRRAIAGDYAPRAAFVQQTVLGDFSRQGGAASALAASGGAWPPGSAPAEASLRGGAAAPLRARHLLLTNAGLDFSVDNLVIIEGSSVYYTIKPNAATAPTGSDVVTADLSVVAPYEGIASISPSSFLMRCSSSA